MDRLLRFTLAAVSMLWLGFGAAHADVYLVTDVEVTADAENSVLARNKAFDEARIAAAYRLIERLTLPADRAGLAGVNITEDIASRLASAVDVQDEALSGTRYVGELAVKFDKRAVAAYLGVYDIPFVDSQDASALVVATASEQIDPFAWAATWAEKPNPNSLTPYVAGEAPYQPGLSWNDVAADVTLSGARRAIIAHAGAAEDKLYITISELRADYAQPRRIGVAGPFVTYTEAREGVVRYLEREWKQRTVVRYSSETQISAIVRFETPRQWVRIQKALTNSRLVQSVDIEAVTVRGADISFAYQGRPDQLSAELRASGVMFEPQSDGWLLRTVSAQ